jgi:hypothetical protein
MVPTLGGRQQQVLSTSGRDAVSDHGDGSSVQDPNTRSGGSMKRTVMIAGFVAVALAVGATACADIERAPSAPEIADNVHQAPLSLAKNPSKKVKVNGVEWRTTLKSDVSASALIGSAGGVLTLPVTGLRLVVPAGAVSRPTQFGVTAIAGKLVAYDFEPAGSTFPVALRVEQDLAFVDMKHLTQTGALAGYFPGRADLDQTRATASVAEVIPVTWSPTTLSFPVSHFSGYIVSWGRGDE